MPTQRNPVVRHGAILRKGGAHTKSVSANRHQSKRQLDDEIDDYFDEIESSRNTVRRKANDHTATKKGQNNSAPSSFWRFMHANELLSVIMTATIDSRSIGANIFGLEK